MNDRLSAVVIAVLLVLGVIVTMAGMNVTMNTTSHTSLDKTDKNDISTVQNEYIAVPVGIAVFIGTGTNERDPESTENNGVPDIPRNLRWYRDHGAALLACWWTDEQGRCACGNAECYSPGKHPLGKLVPHGLKDASKDPGVWLGWLRHYPRANFAMRTGAASGIDVLDQDGAAAGEAIRRAGIAPGPVVITGRVDPSGERVGRHYYVNHTDGARNWSHAVEGKDFRGDDGYVLTVGATHASGKTYEWVEGTADLSIPPTPEWLRATQRPAPPAPAPQPTAPLGPVNEGEVEAVLRQICCDTAALAVFTEGQKRADGSVDRSRTEFYIAGWLSRHGFSESIAWEVVRRCPHVKSVHDKRGVEYFRQQVWAKLSARDGRVEPSAARFPPPPSTAQAVTKAPPVHSVSLGDRGRVEHSADGVEWIREGVKVDTTWTVIDSHFEVVERLAVDGETYYRVRQDRERLLRAPDMYRILDDSGAIIDHRNARDALSAILRDETRERVRAGHAAIGVYAEADGRLTLCTDPVPLTDEQSEVLQDAGPNVGLAPTNGDVRPHVEMVARFDPDEAYPVVGLSALGTFVQVLRSRGVLVPHVFHVSHRSGLGKSTVALAFTERLYGRRSVSADAIASEFRIAALLDGGLPLTLEEGEKLDTARLSAALKDAAERERFSKRGTKELGLVVFLSRSLVVITGNRFPFTSGPTQVRFLAPAFNVARYAERRTPQARQEFDANFARLRPVGFALARFVLGLYPTLPELVSAVEAARRELESAAGTYPWRDSRRSQGWALVLLGMRAWATFAQSFGLEWPRPDLLEATAFFSSVVQPVERSTFESEVYPVQRFRSWFDLWRAKNRTTSQRALIQGGSEREEVSYHEEVRGEGRLFDNDAIAVGERKIPGSWITGSLLDAYNKEQAVEDRVESLNDLARQAADAAGYPRELVLDLEGAARTHRFSLGPQVRAAFVPEVFEK